MPETDGTGCFGLERDLLRPFRAWTHWESPLGRVVVGALYAGLLSVTSACAEKVRIQFRSLRHFGRSPVFSKQHAQQFANVFFGRCLLKIPADAGGHASRLIIVEIDVCGLDACHGRRCEMMTGITA
jgi:hypothetical protein